MTNRGIFQKLRPLSLLAHLSGCYDSAHLQVFSKEVSWSIHLEQGKITYASHSIDPFDRLDRHLRRLAHQIPTLVSETRAQLRLMFEADLESQSIPDPDYQAICWLVSHEYIDKTQAAVLIEGLVKEVIESFLLVKEGTYELGNKLDTMPEFCKLDLQPILQQCQKQLQGWQSLGPQITSPYQRPYFLNRNKSQQLLPEIQQKLSAMLKGFSFRHLAVLLNQDELQLAQSLHPYIVDKTILLHEPHPPFDQLPKTFEELPASPLESVSPTRQTEKLEDLGDRSKAPISHHDIDNAAKPWDRMWNNNKLSQISTRPPENVPSNLQRRGIGPASQDTAALDSFPTASNTANPYGKTPATPANKSKYTIACVDDSPTILKEISYFLDDESFAVFTIGDSIKALMQIVRLKPDMILLDVNMAGIDGYELCRLLRNHSLFKNTPIIMVTGNTGIIDRVKARLVGASGYLTKPFSQSDLLKMVFKHLS